MRPITFLTGFATLILVDFMWIYANKERYMNVTAKMTQVHVFRWPAVISCYLFLGMLILFFIIPDVEDAHVMKKSIFIPIGRSALLGAIVYGVYATTNCAVVSSYTMNTAIIETLWGSILLTITSTMIVLMNSQDLA